MHHHEPARNSSRGVPNDTGARLAASSSKSKSSNGSNGSSNGSEPAWMAFNTIIDIKDDDLMFGGKPLCTWYEEDRRCSVGEESRHHGHGHGSNNVSSPGSTTGSSTDEDEERGRRRDRPQYISKPHKQH
ncbi:hypothetical protein SCUCBS95973_009007 [Sporothrix curviconia]|uniref:Uncharacterized protein n=1 Tax=Sporothrix curviconia TaxID=1260050 RepID=A0ABP0CRA0_9PEZI